MQSEATTTARAVAQRSLIPVIVDAGCCIGCGACAVVAPNELTMRVGGDGMYRPTARDGRTLWELAAVEGALPDELDAVCPFSASAADEDELAAEQFGDGPRHDAIGRYETIWAGHVAEEGFRSGGSSGGMTTWLLAEALRRDDVDAVIHIHSDRRDGEGTYSSYTVSRTVDEVMGGRGSRYHVQTLEEVMAELRRTPGRYAIVGVPCFIKAVRLLGRQDPVIASRTTLTVSLVCGHLKSSTYTTYLGWSVGVAPGELADVDYRHKVENRPANRYAIAATATDGRRVETGVEHIPMSDWGIGLFKPSACDYCDDVVGETADVTCGDAWLPPLMSDWRGANVVVTRSPLARSLVSGGIADGRLALDEWTADQVAASQASGLRHRREGLSIRLARRQQTGMYTPPKRVAPDPAALDTPLGKRMLLREQIARTSHVAFADAIAAGSLEVFHRQMRPLVNRYHGSRGKTVFRQTGSWVLYRLPVPVERALRRATAGRRFT
jgi:coenzyme F420-reducing hydrogenase beta subunit